MAMMSRGEFAKRLAIILNNRRRRWQTKKRALKHLMSEARRVETKTPDGWSSYEHADPRYRAHAIASSLDRAARSLGYYGLDFNHFPSWQLGVCTKRAYKSHSAAWEDIRAHAQKMPYLMPTDTFYVYKCEKCGRFHIQLDTNYWEQFGAVV